jgi:hypothetical protein
MKSLYKLAQSKTLCIFSLFLLYPLGLYLVFQNEDWKRGKIFKWITTTPLIAGVLFIVLTLTLGLSGVLDDIPEKPVIEQDNQARFSLRERQQIYKEVMQASFRAIQESEAKYPYFSDENYDKPEVYQQFEKEVLFLETKYVAEVMQKYELAEDEKNQIMSEGMNAEWKEN